MEDGEVRGCIEGRGDGELILNIHTLKRWTCDGDAVKSLK